MKILAVDDDENICELLSEAVSVNTEHTLVTVNSGPEAIRAIAKAKVPFDCFLLDIQMPIMDGITLAAKIRKIKGHARTPILMLTAMSQKKYIDAAFNAGATDYITKPFDFLELFTRITMAERLVGEQQRIQESASELAAMKKDLIFNASHSLDEPIELTGVTQLVGYVAFEDQLLQLPRSKLHRSVAFSVKINTVGAAYKSMPSVAFRHMLTDIGSELMSVIADNDAMATYRGNGTFLCVMSRNTPFSSTRFEAELNGRLEYVPSTQLDGLQNNVSVGEAFSLRSLTRAGALFAVQKAITSAETRASAQRDVLKLLRRSVRLHPGSGFQNEMERRAYESLLQESLRENSNGGTSAAAFG